MNFKCFDRSGAARGLAGFGIAALAVLGFGLGSGTADAAPPARVVSINLCTDQLLLALADASQIAALGRFARDPGMSFLAAAAARHPLVRGTAEEVFKLRPDLVVAGAFSGRATRAMLAAHGVRVETFEPPRTIAAAKVEVERMAGLLGQAARGRALVEEIERAEAAAAARRAPTVSALAVQRRGFVSGRDTLLSDAMERAGFANAAVRLGIESIGRASLEAIVKLRPKVFVLEEAASPSEQSAAVLNHPVLARSGIGTHAIRLPAAETACAGPGLAPLIGRLASAAAAVRRSEAGASPPAPR
jgi:iron complex transport system substrate-binding protein